MTAVDRHQEDSLAGAGASGSGLSATAWINRCTHGISLPLGTAAGPLAGLTFAVKDNTDVAGFPTKAACPAFAYTPQAHAIVVQKLLDAGASLVGKTNLDQFAHGLSGTRSPYGAVSNAFDTHYVSRGSSAGFAYAVATGQVDFEPGTDTADLGRVPAGLNNIVGLQPSRGLISSRGVVPAAPSVDCVSIFARSVSVAAQVLASALGYDAADTYSRPLMLASRAFPPAFRFGVPREPQFFGDTLAEAAWADAIVRLRAMGGTAVAIDFTPLAAVAELLHSSALVAGRYDAIRPFFDAQADAVIEPVHSIIAAGRAFDAADVFAAQTQVRALGQQARAMWAGIDVLVVPTAPTHYTQAQMQADPVRLNRHLGCYTNFVNLLDYAALSVPSTLRPDGLPFGITLIGPCASDWQLAELGHRYHHRTGLAQGATGLPLPALQPIGIAGIHQSDMVRIAVVGAHMSGMPLNGQLTTRQAVLVAHTKTAADYRLYALPGTTPPKPGLLWVAKGRGTRIAVEVWHMPVCEYGSFVTLIPAPLGIGTSTLADGSEVQGFVCEAEAVRSATDISHLGGWRAYLHSLADEPQGAAPALLASA